MKMAMKTAAVWVLSAAILPAVLAWAAQKEDVMDADKARFETGVKQVATLWTAEDGSEAEFKEFCSKNFYTGKGLDTLFERFESKFEKIDGHFTAMGVELRRELDEDRVEQHPVDEMFAAYAPAAHLSDDLFKNKLAFVVLLNFPLRTLEECREQGPRWTRRQWAEARLAQRFLSRVPASVEQAVSKAHTDAHNYINNYNVFMDRVAGPDGKPMFRPGLKLISHWGLRDELRALYSDPKANLDRQKTIYRIMERIIRQEIPKDVVNSSRHQWEPFANTLDGAAAEREPDTRYRTWIDVFKAHRLEDPHYPGFPTHIERSFKLEREMPEADVEKMLVQTLEAPVGRDVAALIGKRLGRDLLPFDIWYDGFKQRGEISEPELDKIVSAKYPNLDAFQRGIPAVLEKLGFDAPTAAFLASKIEADPARGAGHAQGAEMRSESSHLRTRVPPGGMNYQGFNVAMHELGHCVEQTFSLNRVDHTLLHGVPNNAFTEAFAFVFQAKDLEVLGLEKSDEKAEAMKVLDQFWSLREIAGVALVEMRAWRWLYAHPDAKPAEFREAVAAVGTEVWNRYYAPVFKVKDSPVLAIYSHMIDYGLYIPHYPIGYIIDYQISDYFRTHSLGKEMERMCVSGRLTPDEWMRKAVGSDVSAAPVIEGAAAALKKL